MFSLPSFHQLFFAPSKSHITHCFRTKSSSQVISPTKMLRSLKAWHNESHFFCSFNGSAIFEDSMGLVVLPISNRFFRAFRCTKNWLACFNRKRDVIRYIYIYICIHIYIWILSILLVQTSHRHDSNNCNVQGIPSCWNSLCNYFRSSATIGHVGYFWYCRNGINIVPITPGILYSYTNLNKSWRTHSVIERSLPTFSENPRVEVLEVGRNWSLFIANEVNDHPKNMSQILRISSTTWNMTHLCSMPHGAFYAWTRMARVQKMDDILYFHVFLCPPCPLKSGTSVLPIGRDN